MTFDDIFHNFTKTETWKAMLNTREDSPYHREANVAEHTRLSLAAYRDNFMNSRSLQEQMVSRVAIMFHDAGKPRAETPKYSEARGNYRSYGGHEQISAAWFVDYASTNKLPLNDFQIRAIRWMIEHHLPYDKGPQKMAWFREDMVRTLGPYLQAYADVLMSDAMGRITEVDKTPKVIEWIAANVKEHTVPEMVYARSPYAIQSKTAHIMVGPSSSGKSTAIKTLTNDYTKVFSFDTLRMSFYKARYGSDAESYSIAWTFANENKDTFKKYAQHHFTQLLDSEWDIIIDNTNLSPKVRRQWIALLRQRGYWIVGHEFWNSLEVLDQRRKTRPELNLAVCDLHRQYFAQSMLRYGEEVDEIIMRRG